MSKAFTIPPYRPEERGALVSLTIDGQAVKARAGDTVLQAAKSAGIRIPHMCNVKELEPQGGCRVCVVEVEGRDRPVISCGTAVEDGMNVTTASEKIERLRRTYLELMLSDHNAFCAPPCKYGCPTRVDGPGFIGLIAAGDLEESQRVLKANLPFPSILGRVCPHPCEEVCRREEVDQPISICRSHRYVGDVAIEKAFHPEEPEPATGKKVAVIGAGPAGLANAYYLALRGHEVTIYDNMPEPGGTLRYGIPAYRLPRDIIDAELKPIWEMGVKLVSNTSLGPDFSVDDLLGEMGYDAVFLGLGAMQSRPMGIEGEELKGVISVLDFLRDIHLGEQIDVGKKVVVIGGGFSAMDAARVSVRLGAKEIAVVYRRTQKEMPAHEIEVKEAMEEGVEFTFLAAPTRVEGRDGKVTGLWFERMELGEPDDSGRRRPERVPGSEYLVEADTIIPAVGQLPRLTWTKEEEGEVCEFLPEESEIKCTRWQTVAVNERTFQSDRPQVFAGGDVVNGAATAVEAVAGGKEAAWAMDAFLKGMDMAEYEASLPPLKKPAYLRIPAYREEQEPRRQTAILEPGERRDNFAEVDGGFSPDTVDEESNRCLQCICEAVETCKLRRYSIDAGLTQEKGNRADNRFPGRQNLFGRDASHDFIIRDPNRCIRCGRCENVCKHLTGSGCYDFTGRGPETIVATPFDVSLGDTDCVSCGRCAEHCPTGALFTRERQLVNWHLDTSRCIFCSDCVEVCPVDALATTPEFELATGSHDDLHFNLLDKAREGDSR